jgi:hypothetical protein
MSEEKSNPADSKPPAVTTKPPKKLQPRVAAKPATKVVAAEPPAVKAPAAKKPAAKKSSPLEETKARNKKALSEALVKAQAVQIPPPPMVPQSPAESPKATKPGKAKKIKLVRHSFSMPETEYAQFAVLKKRVADFGGKVKRSELVRAGIAVLSALDNVELTAAMARVERIKAGRPAK